MTKAIRDTRAHCARCAREKIMTSFPGPYGSLFARNSLFLTFQIGNCELTKTVAKVYVPVVILFNIAHKHSY